LRSTITLSCWGDTFSYYTDNFANRYDIACLLDHLLKHTILLGIYLNIDLVGLKFSEGIAFLNAITLFF
jgi:hypothetical protein